MLDTMQQEEYQAATQSAALFDTSSRSKIEVRGPEAASFLHNLCTNDIVNMPIGAGCEAFLATSTAKAVAFVNIYHYLAQNDHEAFWIDSEPGSAERIIQHLDHYLISEQVEFADRTTQFAQMHLAGPNAKSILERALLDDVPDLEEHLHMVRTFGTDLHCHIRRHDPLGVPGFDIVCLAELSPRVAEILVRAGARLASEPVYVTLRIEAGTPIFGADIDDKRFVIEVNRTASAISYEKGCFLGQEPIVMARDRGQVQRRFIGVKLEGNDPLPTGSVLHSGEKEAGVTTSSVYSPAQGCAIALGYIRRAFTESGTTLTTAEGRKATVTELPFHRG